MKNRLERNKYILFGILFLALIICSSLIFGYSKSFWEGIFIGLHGVFVEILLIVIIFESIQRKINTNQVKKVMVVLKPKIKDILSGYEYIIELTGQGKDSEKLIWEDLSKTDFLKKPNVEPFSGNTADYIKRYIEKNENMLNNILYKYSQILDYSLLRNLELLIDHDFFYRLKFMPDVILMNKEGYIKYHNEFRYFSLMPEQEKTRLSRSFGDLIGLLKETKGFISGTN